ncbi:MAG: hypothetical protein L0271_04090, partial [Gemmatimonadetes bacterium]|nr:hypothetical protein [Gemmatimonadota bacterium]
MKADTYAMASPVGSADVEPMARAVGLDDRALLDAARRVLTLGAEALQALEQRLGDPFLDAVRVIHGSPGRVIVSGIGK